MHMYYNRLGAVMCRVWLMTEMGGEGRVWMEFFRAAIMLYGPCDKVCIQSIGAGDM